MTIDISPYRVAIAQNQQELESVYRLRYEVFFSEGGDGRYADHELKFWRDEDDCPESTIIAVWNETGAAVATMRLTCRKHREFIGHSVYHFDVLAGILNISENEVRLRVVRTDRVAILRDHRGKGLIQLCQSLFEVTALNYGCNILVACPGVGNLRSRRAFEKIGWREYPVQVTFRGFTAQMIYKKI